MIRKINRILEIMDIQPILIDVGASGAPPKIWNPIAQNSIYIGFDPDLRETSDLTDGKYYRSTVLNKAVIEQINEENVNFYLTKYPYCSSTLPPDSEALSNYLFSNLFEIEGEESVAAITLNAVIEQLKLNTVDWIKTDSQGIDLRIFQSIRNNMREQVLAVDIEPGLIDAYKGEDLFIDAHREITRQGFWLSNINIGGAVRMRHSTLEELESNSTRLIELVQRPSPAYCEARYLRTVEWLIDNQLPAHRYILLWTFAILDEQYGFALDIATAYGQRFGVDELAELLFTTPLTILKSNREWKLRSIGTMRRYAGKLADSLGFN